MSESSGISVVEPQQTDRRTFIGWTGMTTLGLGSALWLSGCSPNASTAPSSVAPATASPSTEKAGVSFIEGYSGAGIAPLDGVTETVLSFRLPTLEGPLQTKVRDQEGKDTDQDTLNDTSIAYAAAVAARGGRVLLAIGGDNDGISNASLNHKFDIATQSQAEFVKHIGDDVAAVEGRLGHKLSGVFFDWEGGPANNRQAVQYAATIGEYRSVNPDHLVGVAVPAAGFRNQQNGFHFPASQLPANFYSLMGHDLRGTWDPDLITGYAADGKTTIKYVKTFVDGDIKDSSKLRVIAPAYWYIFKNSKGIGKTFEDGSVDAMQYGQVPSKLVHDIPEALASEAHLENGNYASGASPAMIGETWNRIRNLYPTIGGFGYWAARGMTPDHAAVLKRNIVS